MWYSTNFDVHLIILSLYESFKTAQEKIACLGGSWEDCWDFTLRDDIDGITISYHSLIYKVSLEMPCSSTFETTISLRICSIVPLSIRNVYVARTSVVAGKVPYFVTLMALLGLPNDIYSLIDSNKTVKDLWDALARHMLGFEYGEQDRKAAVLYEYETFKATIGELLFDTFIRYIQVINDLKKWGYSKDKCELNFKFLNNLQFEWKQYATMMRQNKNLMDINIDALYNILKQNQGDVNDSMGFKKKPIVVTSDPLALIAEKTKVSESKKKVVVSLESKGSSSDDFSELKKITALLENAFNRRKFYSKPTNNN
nr:hypothetical protein [Tanacetum cinerariifolium]